MTNGLDTKRILIADDDVDTCTLLSRFLGKNGYLVEHAHSGKSALAKVATQPFDLILSDFRLGDMEGLEMLTEIKKINQSIPVIIITGYSDIKTAVNVIKSGAFDYVAKPLIPDEILHTVKKALAAANIEQSPAVASNGESKAPTTAAKKSTSIYMEDDFIIGDSSIAKELHRQISLVAPTNFSVIIYGESGSGKEAVARTIHNHSPRKDKPFVALDCGAISRELAGSELFGHEKGSFTGAIGAKTGHFELANGGTLFLDEVGNLPYDIQVALLRVVQERRVRKIGGNKEIPLDVRILVASNEDLMESHRKGKFREDLFHRFNEFSIHVPPLRERQKDIMLFANYFLTSANKELNKDVSGFSSEVLNCFLQYAWPGNIREMKNVIKRAALLSDDSLIHAKNLPLEISNPSKFISQSYYEPLRNGNRELLTTISLKNAAQEAEYEAILKVLKQVNFNKSKAAKLLNIDRKTLYNKMKGFNLLREESSSPEVVPVENKIEE
jgi:two-component system, NtrC family, response regulator HydG